MQPRITDRKALAKPIQAMLEVSARATAGIIEPHLRHLVDMRASQINGCAYCLALHAKQLLEDGERVDRLAVLDAWRETAWFTDRERAALAWTEAVTTLEHREVPDAVYALAREQFSEAELAELTLNVIVINGWNRLNIAFHTPPEAFTIEQVEAVAAD